MKTVLELLTDPKHWTRSADARDTNGVSVEPQSEKASCWCINGGLQKVYGSSTPEYYRAWKKVAETIERLKRFQPLVAAYNDHETTTHQDILDVLKEAGV